MADCALPGACFSEKEGTFTNQEGRVQRLARLMRPVGRSKRDFRVLLSVGRRLDPSFAAGIAHARDVFTEIRESVGIYADVSLDFVNQRNEANELDNRSSLVGSSGKTVDLPTDRPVTPAVVDDQRPYTLVTGNHLFYSGRLTRRSAILDGLLQGPVVEISAQDATDLGVSDGDQVRVSGRRHEVVLTARIRRGSRRGVVFIDENYDTISVYRFFDKGRYLARVAVTKA